MSSIILPNTKIVTSKTTQEDCFIERILEECNDYKPVKDYIIYRNDDFYKVKDEVDAKVERDPSYELAGMTDIPYKGKELYIAVLVQYDTSGDEAC